MTLGYLGVDALAGFGFFIGEGVNGFALTAFGGEAFGYFLCRFLVV